MDPLTVEIHMKTTYPPLLDSLSQTGIGFISPSAVAKYGADISKNPVGTGFMKFVSYSPKEKIEFVKNPDYNWAPAIWGHTGPAYLDKFTVIVADDPAARVTALESGDVNAIEDTPGQDVARLSADPKYQLIKGFIPGAPRTFFLNIEKAPLDDIKVRRQSTTGIDHDELAKLATVGTQPGAHGPFSPATPGHSDEADKIFSYDPAKAGRDPRRCRLDAGGGRHPRQGRPEAGAHGEQPRSVRDAVHDAAVTDAEDRHPGRHRDAGHECVG